MNRLFTYPQDRLPLQVRQAPNAPRALASVSCFLSLNLYEFKQVCATILGFVSSFVRLFHMNNKNNIPASVMELSIFGLVTHSYDFEEAQLLVIQQKRRKQLPLSLLIMTMSTLFLIVNSSPWKILKFCWLLFFSKARKGIFV